MTGWLDSNDSNRQERVGWFVVLLGLTCRTRAQTVLPEKLLARTTTPTNRSCLFWLTEQAASESSHKLGWVLPKFTGLERSRREK